MQSIDATAQIAATAKIYDFVYVGARSAIGDFTHIANLVHIDHDVLIGERCKIEGGAYICSETQIQNNVFIGPHVVFTNDHYPASYRDYGTVKLDGVTVQDGAIIGAGAVIGPGVVVGENAVVGMGSVVLHGIEPETVVAGNPAKFLTTRQCYDVKQAKWNL